MSQITTVKRGWKYDKPQARQHILTGSTTKHYALGTMLNLGMRRFRYVKAVSAITAAYGCYGNATFPEAAVAGGTTAANNKTITCTAQSTVTTDQFENGIANIGYAYQYEIDSNTAAAAGNTFTVTLKDNLVAAVTSATTRVVLIPSPFSEVVCGAAATAEAAKVTYIGVALNNYSNGEYFWLQTYGPCIIVGTDNVGGDNNERSVVWNSDGSVICEYHTGIHSGFAWAGNIYTNNYWSGGGHDADSGFVPVFLQLDK